MASFYNNNYYKYYRPYLSTNFKNSPDTSQHSPNQDKSSFHSICDENHSRTNGTKEDKSSDFYTFGPIRFKNPFFNNIEEPIFEILGIELYLDDIIILGLLFFLYQEGVQDEMLFISLILLLIS